MERLWLFSSLILGAAIFMLPGCESQIARNQHLMETELDAAARIIKQQRLLGWYYACEGKMMALAETYENYPEIFSPESIARIEAIIPQTADSAGKAYLQRTRLFFTNEHLRRLTMDREDQIRRLRHRPVALAAKDSLPYYRLESWMRRAVRSREYSQIMNDTRAISADIIERRATGNQLLERGARTLGWDGYRDFLGRLLEIDPTELERLASETLTITRASYRQLLSGAVQKRLHLPVSGLRLGDILFLIDTAPLENLPPDVNRDTRISALLDVMSISTGRQPGLDINRTANRQKTTNAYCAVIDIPGDVRLFLPPVNTLAAVQDGSAMMGRTQYALGTLEKTALEATLMYSPAPGATGQLFADIWSDSAWLASRYPVFGQGAADLADYARLRRLTEIRLAAAGLLIALTTGPEAAEKNDPTALLEEALLSPLNEGEALWLQARQPDPLEAIDRFLGHWFSGRLKLYLETHHPATPWFSNTAAMRELKSIWQRGHRWTAGSLLEKLGGESPGAAVFGKL